MKTPEARTPIHSQTLLGGDLSTFVCIVCGQPGTVWIAAALLTDYPQPSIVSAYVLCETCRETHWDHAGDLFIKNLHTSTAP